MNFDPTDDPADRDDLVESLRRMRPAPSNIDPSSLFYEAGFLAGRSQPPPRVIGLMQVVAAGMVAAVVCVSVAAPLFYRAGQASVVKPDSAPDFAVAPEETAPQSRPPKSPDVQIAGVPSPGIQPRSGPSSSGPSASVHDSDGSLADSSSTGNSSIGLPPPSGPTWSVRFRSQLFAYWTAVSDDAQDRQGSDVASSSLAAYHSSLAANSGPYSLWPGFLNRNDALPHREPSRTAPEYAEPRSLKTLVVGDVRALSGVIEAVR